MTLLVAIRQRRVPPNIDPQNSSKPRIIMLVLSHKCITPSWIEPTATDIHFLQSSDRTSSETMPTPRKRGSDGRFLPRQSSPAGISVPEDGSVSRSDFRKLVEKVELLCASREKERRLSKNCRDLREKLEDSKGREKSLKLKLETAQKSYLTLTQEDVDWLMRGSRFEIRESVHRQLSVMLSLRS
jgi:hypothetical protein